MSVDVFFSSFRTVRMGLPGVSEASGLTYGIVERVHGGLPFCRYRRPTRVVLSQNVLPCPLHSFLKHTVECGLSMVGGKTCISLLSAVSAGNTRVLNCKV